MQLFQHAGDNYFAVSLNGVEVGNLPSKENLEELLVRARHQAVRELGSNELVFMDTELETVGSGCGLWSMTRKMLSEEWQMS